MTVYVCTSGEYSDYHIDAIFTDEEQAELYLATHERTLDNPYIEERETDEVKFESCVPVKNLWIASIRNDGSVSYICSRLTLENRKTVEPFSKCFGRTSTTGHRVSITLDKDITKEKALKIIFDYLAKWEAEHCGI